METRFRTFIVEQAHYLSFAIALIATVGSLYFSEVMQFEPCLFCWYIRTLMYPLVIILGMAAVRKDVKQSVYTIPFTLIGGALSLYLYMIQKIPSFNNIGSTTCGDIPCSTTYINWYGFITIPFLALVAFVLIFVLQLLLWRVSK